jgi:hypothetical protein
MWLNKICQTIILGRKFPPINNLLKFSSSDSDLAHFLSRLELFDKKLPLMK